MHAGLRFMREGRDRRRALLPRLPGWPAAEELAAELAAGGAGYMARIKVITATGGLLDRLHAERRANQEAWAKALAADPGLPS